MLLIQHKTIPCFGSLPIAFLQIHYSRGQKDFQTFHNTLSECDRILPYQSMLLKIYLVSATAQEKSEVFPEHWFILGQTGHHLSSQILLSFLCLSPSDFILLLNINQGPHILKAVVWCYNLLMSSTLLLMRNHSSVLRSHVYMSRHTKSSGNCSFT